MVRHAIAAFGVGVVVIACNGLTGSSELSTCEGAACADPSASSSSGASGSSSSGTASSSGAPDGSTGGDDGSTTLPPDCKDGDRACEGRTAATCTGSTWTKTPCEETCLAGSCVAWPSCRNAAGTACGTNSTSCCESKPVPGGTFKRRNDGQYPATVSAFSLDVYEVTVGRFRAFLDGGTGGTQMSPPAVGAGAHPKIAGSGWQATWTNYLPVDTAGLRSFVAGGTGTWTGSAGTNEHKPIDNVSWFIAFAFCAWDGGRLPTYAEWGFAASGGSEQRLYPWSSPPTDPSIDPKKHAAYTCGFNSPAYTCPPSVCSANGASPCDATACAALAGTCSTQPCYGCDFTKDVAPVGSLVAGAGRYGQYDLGGNFSELLLDALVKKDQNALLLPCTDCAPLMPSTPIAGGPTETVVYNMGGEWDQDSSSIRNDNVDTMTWSSRSSAVGFRCAR